MNDKRRSVNTKFWIDPFIEELTPNEKLLFLYLLTNPLTNLLGIYEITIKRICYDTCLDNETVRNGLKGFETVKKAYYVDNYIYLPNFLKNQHLNGNMKISVCNDFSDLHNSLIDKLLLNPSEWLPNDKKGFETIVEHLGKGKGKVKGNNEIEVEREIEIKDNYNEKELLKIIKIHTYGFEVIAKNNSINKKQLWEKVDEFLKIIIEARETFKITTDDCREFQSHFSKWIKLNLPKKQKKLNPTDRF